MGRLKASHLPTSGLISTTHETRTRGKKKKISWPLGAECRQQNQIVPVYITTPLPCFKHAENASSHTDTVTRQNTGCSPFALRIQPQGLCGCTCREHLLCVHRVPSARAHACTGAHTHTHTHPSCACTPQLQSSTINTSCCLSAMLG